MLLLQNAALKAIMVWSKLRASANSLNDVEPQYFDRV
jgi:hypothetical protein